MRAIVPIQLGCCPAPPRCILCGPRQHDPTPDLVEARMEAVRRERPGAELRVRFFGGPPPSDALLEVTRGIPVDVRVRPDLLDRTGAARLAQHGVEGLELDALSFHDDVLRGAGRRYGRGRLVAMLDALTGFRRGIVLAMGLPGQTHARSLEDAELACPRVETARLHPVLVIRGSTLWKLHLEGLYTPLTLSQAVTTSRVMLERFEQAGVEVIRVGQQPGPDELGRAVAGPRHSALRELVEARRTLDTLRAMLRERMTDGGTVRIRCASADETRTRGPLNDNVRTLRAEFGLEEVIVQADPTLERGQFVLEAS